LSAIQRDVLVALADVRPRWTLVGGAALAGVYLGHRETRDLDLFWRGLDKLGDVANLVADKCHVAGFQSQRLQVAASFVRLRVSRGDEVVIVDLVADPTERLDGDVDVSLDANIQILVASRREILADKLCALLGRSELRDLVDVAGLVGAGADLEQALLDAPKKDGGFSPLTLAWTLRSLDVPALSGAAGVEPRSTQELDEFKNDLIERLIGDAKPEE
jgi:hypothetical protein